MVGDRSRKRPQKKMDLNPFQWPKTRAAFPITSSWQGQLRSGCELINANHLTEAAEGIWTIKQNNIVWIPNTTTKHGRTNTINGIPRDYSVLHNRVGNMIYFTKSNASPILPASLISSAQRIQIFSEGCPVIWRSWHLFKTKQMLMLFI